ncbi:MAG TPA: IPT/TIG domain-containing protein [Mycobacteriales bacterium]|nr:IPT/TIG domain-containing protein [Mycobacteriales bacterium]
MKSRRGSQRAAAAALSALALAGPVVTNHAALANATGSTLACVSSGTSGVALTGGGRADVLDTFAQVLPAVHQDGASAATICAARDSYASFQLEVTAPAGGLSGISMSASDLTGTGGTLPGTNPSTSAVAPGAAGFPDVQLSREDYTTITSASDGELSDVLTRKPDGTCTGPPGHAGDCRFPDALVPDRDALLGQPRKAFPFSVPANENRVVWVDIFVPAATSAGQYNGTITIAANGTTAASIPVALNVISATLPATSSLQSAFFMGLGGIPVSTYEQYADLGLNDRIAIQPQGLGSSGDMHAALTNLTNGLDAAVRLTDQSGTHRAILPDFVLGTDGWFDSFKADFPSDVATQPFAFCDEFTPTHCQDTYANGGDGTSHSAKTAWPLPLLATDAGTVYHSWPDPCPPTNVDPCNPAANPVPPTMTPQPKGLILLPEELAPNSTNNDWTGSDATPPPGREHALAAWRDASPGDRILWAYTTCDDIGRCDKAAGYDSSTRPEGWPGYGIDQDATAQQAMGWLLYDGDASHDQLQGEEYWNVNRDDHSGVPSPLSYSGDPNATGAWSSISEDSYMANGDGTLFYPYDNTNEKVGGSSPIPLESIRLKRIRDGRQDYELLKLAGPAFSDSLVDATFNSTNGLYHSASMWDDASIPPSVLDAAEQTLINHFATAPTVTSVAPKSGPKAGGTSVTINGTGFTHATAVTFGAAGPASSYHVHSSTQITAVSPPSSTTGPVDVTVTAAGNTSAVVTADHFTYGTTPKITSITPNSGPTTGGTSVTIRGSGFTGTTAVRFGGAGAATSYHVHSSTQITAVSPATSTARQVNVFVTAAGSTSAAAASDHFTYVAP